MKTNTTSTTKKLAAAPKATDTAMKKEVDGLKADVAGIKGNMDEFNDTLDKVVGAVNKINASVETLAKNFPVVTNKLLTAEEQFMGTEGDAKFSESKAGEQILAVPDGTHMDDPLFQEKLKKLQWDQGIIEVDILAPPDDQMPPVFEITVNGTTQIFHHNTRVKVKRMFVEGLARAKPSTFGNVERNDPTTGEKEYVYPVRKGLKYGFALVNPNKQESIWIQAVMAEP